MEFVQRGHVSTHTNPADCESRGLKPTELNSYDLWWNDPDWLLSQSFNVRSLTYLILMRRNDKKQPHLKNDDEETLYHEYLSASLPNPLDPHDNVPVQSYYNNIVNAITQSLQNAKIPPSKKPHKRHKILSDNTVALMERRKLLLNTKNKNRSMKNELSALYKLVSKRIKQDYARYRADTVEKHLIQSGSSKRAFKELRTNRKWIDGLKSEGKTANSRHEIKEIATKFYRSLYSTQDQKSYEENPDLSNTFRAANSNECIPFTTTEVTQAINRLKANKSPGSDNITNEALKSAVLLLAQPLTVLFNRILKSSTTPTQWSESEYSSIKKETHARLGTIGQ
ncbi:endonuclease-reverse transcriptase [Danaus plexippus plexippus]|uniref:Endonuclease-reverse transcriptase n=1 Tax=Danaus plexippus plexippus TaxID=278856 RepID=A0A212FGG8_DANPL|nr:endonuclease-reverse transcriptase [Danaus plexippus plexippus]